MTQATASLTTAPVIEATATPERSTGDAFAVTSFVLGLVSVIAGFVFIAPLVGLVFGVMAKNRHTTQRSLAAWGIALSIIMLAVWIVAVLILLQVAGFAFLAVV